MNRKIKVTPDPHVDHDKVDALAKLNSARNEGLQPKLVQERDLFQPFPSRLLPSPIRELVTEGARAIGCDESFIALPLLSCVGAAIGNTCRLVVKSGWNVPPSIWTLIVGESGTAKSPAFKVAKSAIQRRQKALLDQYAEESKLYDVEIEQHEATMKERKRSKSTDPTPPPPEPPIVGRCMVSDTTVEALAPILAQNPRGVLLQRDELSGWIGSFNQYKSAKGADEAHWLSMFDGESITVDRKGEGTKPTYVETALVSITGGIQPAILAKAMSEEHRASGMASRFLIASPPRRSQVWSDDEINQFIQLTVEELFESMLNITFADEDNTPHFIGMSVGAKRVFKEFFNSHHQEMTDLTGDMAAAWSKLLGYVPRVALLFHVVERLYANDEITVAVEQSTMSNAIELVEWFKREAARLYATIDDNDVVRELRSLAAWIQRKHDGECTADQLRRGHHRTIPTNDEAEMKLKEIAKAGLGEWSEVAATGGRPKHVFRVF
jgi:hypothetical protein